jgi:hypothetical protein
MITAAGRMLWQFGRGAVRQTKHLSPFTTKSVTKDVIKVKKGKSLKSIGTGFGTHVGKSGKRRFTQELRPWAKAIVGKEGVIAKTGKFFGAKDTKKIRGMTTYGYTRGYKHLRKHKDKYGLAAGGAMAWDIIDND